MICLVIGKSERLGGMLDKRPQYFLTIVPEGSDWKECRELPIDKVHYDAVNVGKRYAFALIEEKSA